MAGVKKCFLVLLLFQGVHSGFCQVGMWHLFTVRYSVNPAWSLHAETQIRTPGMYDYLNYRDLKLGVTWKSPSNARFSLFAGQFQTFQPGGNFVRPFLSNEFRLWGQLALSQTLNRFLIEHRYRIDLRFIGGVRQDRYRYKFGIMYPFSWHPGESKIWQAGLGDEISMTDKAPYFQRNRINFVIGRRISKSLNLQAQFIDNFDYKKETGNWTQYLLFNGQLDLARKFEKKT